MIKEINNWYISIGETAKMLGVHVKTIRRWEKKGIIKEDYRTAGGHKRYEYRKIRELLTEMVKKGKIRKKDWSKIKESKETVDETNNKERKKRVVINVKNFSINSLLFPHTFYQPVSHNTPSPVFLL